MNRTLKRPMFRIGGSVNSGITSGLDQPRKQYSQGTQTSQVPDPGFLQTALGAAATGAGIYGALK